jgi:hypothetical protein
MASPRKRTVAREAARQLGRITKNALRDRERLAQLEAGGTPEHPIVVVSASLVEPKARALPCIACGAAVRLEDHAAKTIRGAALRLAHTSCAMCEHERTIYFTISPPLVN